MMPFSFGKSTSTPLCVQEALRTTISFSDMMTIHTGMTSTDCTAEITMTIIFISRINQDQPPSPFPDTKNGYICFHKDSNVSSAKLSSGTTYSFVDIYCFLFCLTALFCAFTILIELTFTKLWTPTQCYVFHRFTLLLELKDNEPRCIMREEYMKNMGSKQMFVILTLHTTYIRRLILDVFCYTELLRVK